MLGVFSKTNGIKKESTRRSSNTWTKTLYQDWFTSYCKRLGPVQLLWISSEKKLFLTTPDKCWSSFIIMITLFKSQIILAEHECSTNWGDCKSNKPNQIKSIKWNQMLVFEERGKPEFPEKNLSEQSREVENQQTQPTYDAGSGNRTRDTLVEGERSHHCANPAPRMILTPIKSITTYETLESTGEMKLMMKFYLCLHKPPTG